MKTKVSAVIFAVFAIFLLIGAVNVYCVNHGDYSASASLNGDAIGYTVSGPDTNYLYSVYSNTDMPDRIYLYLDDGYRAEYNDQFVQSEFLTVMKQMLERRNYSSIEFADAEKLRTVMTDPDNAVFFVSGALPDTVYNSDRTGLFVDWMNNGGTVYWTGPELGRYISTKTEVKDLGIGLFNGCVNSDFDPLKAFAYDESTMFEYTQARIDGTAYALTKNYPDSLCLAYTDSTYSTLSVAKLGTGNAFIFGGNIAVTLNVSQDVTDRTCTADVIISGLTYRSEGLDHGTGTLKGTVSGRTADIGAETSISIVISVGAPATTWSKAIKIN